MNPTNKGIVAKEWLVFIGCLLIGLLILPWAIYFLFQGQFHVDKFYQALFDGGHSPAKAWAIVICPYILYQLTRTTVWAIKIAIKR